MVFLSSFLSFFFIFGSILSSQVNSQATGRGRGETKEGAQLALLIINPKALLTDLPDSVGLSPLIPALAAPGGLCS